MAAMSPRAHANLPRAAWPFRRRSVPNAQIRRPAEALLTFGFSYSFQKFEHRHDDVVNKNRRKQYERWNGSNQQDEKPAHHTVPKSELRAEATAFNEDREALQPEVGSWQSVASARRAGNYQLMQ